MKKLFLIFFMALSVGAFAQLNEGDMSRYLAKDAVVLRDGFVVFSQKTPLAGSWSMQQIGDVAQAWMEKYLGKYDPAKNRIISNEPGKIVAVGDMMIEFSRNAFSLDRAQMSYVLTLEYSEKESSLSVERIKYIYDDGVSVEKITAEEYITDEQAVNKKRTKLLPISGKFRKKTIDVVDEIFESYNIAFKYYSRDGFAEIVRNVPQVMSADKQNNLAAQVDEPAKPVQPAQAAQPVKPEQPAKQETAKDAQTPANGNMQGYRKISPEEIPGNFIHKVSKEWMLITAGNKEKFNMMTASWGGIGVLYNKPVAICFINPARYTYQVIEGSNGTYTLTFYGEEHRDALKYCGSKSGRDEDKVKGSGLTPIEVGEGAMAFGEATLIIECRKLVSQSISLDAVNNVEERNRRASQPMHKMYIGEIVNVWVK